MNPKTRFYLALFFAFVVGSSVCFSLLYFSEHEAIYQAIGTSVAGGVVGTVAILIRERFKKQKVG